MVPEKNHKSFCFWNSCVTATEIFNRLYFTVNIDTKTRCLFKINLPQINYNLLKIK